MMLQPLDAGRHGDSLWREVGGLHNAELWRWMPDGPFETREEFDAALAAKAVSQDPLHFAICPDDGEALGHCAYLRFEPKHRVVEVGAIMFGPRLRRTRAATEAMYLMAKRAFEEFQVRRYEWKCNALNEPSRRAALRLGFTFEGIFRQHMIVKGVNRDTAWYSMLDSEWPERRERFERWMDPDNFDSSGQQIKPL